MLLCHRVHTILTLTTTSTHTHDIGQYSFITLIRRLLGAHTLHTHIHTRSPPSYSLQDAHMRMAFQHYTQKLFLCMWRRFKRIYKTHAVQKRLLVHLAHLQPSRHQQQQRLVGRPTDKTGGKSGGKSKVGGGGVGMVEIRVSYRDIHHTLAIKHALHRYNQYLVSIFAARAEQKRAYHQHLQRRLSLSLRAFKQHAVDCIRTKSVHKLVLKRCLQIFYMMYGKVKRSRKILRYFSQQQSYIFLDRAMKKWKEDTVFERHVEQLLLVYTQSRQRYVYGKFLQRLTVRVYRRKQTKQAAKYYCNCQRQRFVDGLMQRLESRYSQQRLLKQAARYYYSYTCREVVEQFQYFKKKQQAYLLFLHKGYKSFKQQVHVQKLCNHYHDTRRQTARKLHLKHSLTKLRRQLAKRRQSRYTHQSDHASLCHYTEYAGTQQLKRYVRTFHAHGLHRVYLRRYADYLIQYYAFIALYMRVRLWIVQHLRHKRVNKNAKLLQFYESWLRKKRVFKVLDSQLIFKYYTYIENKEVDSYVDRVRLLRGWRKIKRKGRGGLEWDDEEKKEGNRVRRGVHMTL